MSAVTEKAVFESLSRIRGPDGRDFDASTMVAGLTVKDLSDGAMVSFSIEVDPRNAQALEPLRKSAEDAVKAIPGVIGATAILTAHKNAPQMRGNRPEKNPVTGVKHIIAVASGKGGVGKSTTAVNLAVALAGQGIKTGLLDADIYGPSIPRMLGLKGEPVIRDDRKFYPMERYGLAVMSMGFLVPEDAPMVWRGPMVHSALTQLFRDVAWNAKGDLDVLVLDLPPGTGDAQLTMAQSVPLAGAVIVSTPQDIALIDARKALGMFRKVDVPVLGIIENMSYFKCPHCGERSDIFSHGGARHEAEKLGIPFLGEIPLEISIREGGDVGKPVATETSALGDAFREVAKRLWNKIRKGP
ncbi:MAG: P-loop NTPase [Bdellovibrionales bacterium]